MFGSLQPEIIAAWEMEFTPALILKRGRLFKIRMAPKQACAVGVPVVNCFASSSVQF